MNWQFCTLEQAIELNELGVTQKSLFYWNKPKSGSHGSYIHYGWTSDAVASAFNMAELIEMHRPLQRMVNMGLTAEQLANSLIAFIKYKSLSIGYINHALDILFADEFPALSNNQNVVKSIT